MFTESDDDVDLRPREEVCPTCHLTRNSALPKCPNREDCEVML